MGQCCARETANESKIANIFDSLKICTLTANEVIATFNKYKRYTSNYIDNSDFFLIVNDLCLSEDREVNINLQLFWEKYYSLKPYGDTDTYILFNFVVLSKKTEEKILALMFILSKYIKETTKNVSLINYQILEEFILDLIKSFTFITLLPMRDLLESADDYDYLKETAFTEANIVKYVHETMFDKKEYVPVIEFFEKHMDKLSSVTAIRSNLISFAECSESKILQVEFTKRKTEV